MKSETLRKKGEEQNPSSSQLKAPGRGGTSPREQSHGVNCGSWSPSVYPFYSEQCMTPYQPQSICTGGEEGDVLCGLCGGKGTMAHILSGCKIALTQGRYRWRHDKVLAVLADILEQERRKKQPAKARPLLSTIVFVKEGQRPVVHSQASQNLLQSAQGWEMEVDLGRKLHFPEAVLSTTLRPDIIMWSPEGKKIILVELTGTVRGGL